MRLWDVRTPNCQGIVHCGDSPVVAYDPEGLVFAIGTTHANEIKLYDARNPEKGPFLTAAGPRGSWAGWCRHHIYLLTVDILLVCHCVCSLFLCVSLRSMAPSGRLYI